MPLELPPLPYPYNALEPHIGERTCQIHHDKHHAAYVNNTNKMSKLFNSSSKNEMCIVDFYSF